MSWLVQRVRGVRIWSPLELGEGAAHGSASSIEFIELGATALGAHYDRVALNYCLNGFSSECVIGARSDCGAELYLPVCGDGDEEVGEVFLCHRGVFSDGVIE